jgi:hypothetical protein
MTMVDTTGAGSGAAGVDVTAGSVWVALASGASGVEEAHPDTIRPTAAAKTSIRRPRSDWVIRLGLLRIIEPPLVGEITT